jgi:RimJ/RimL family protein N-acetyltransferase
VTIYHLRPLSAAQAKTICRWRYAAGYGLYNMSEDDLDCLLSPAFAYHGVCRGDQVETAEDLIGFACFGQDAQVHGGPYSQPALDLGCGLDPALCGQGLGQDFVAAIIAFASRRYAPPLLRLSVAQANHRAITVYERVGFIVRRRFIGMTRSGVYPFLVMTRRPDRSQVARKSPGKPFRERE